MWSFPNATSTSSLHSRISILDRFKRGTSRYAEWYVASMASSRSQENRLIQETSPYLRQHAHNPVDWYPWGEEALSRARREDKPILLSIGYAACHWCHVMERESFENESTAALMNAHYVCIKVDREERPDLDDVYMAATVAMTGQGGWPMTVFLTPEQKPFFAGTYFPPDERYGRPAFSTILTRLAEAFLEDRKGVEEQAAKLTQAVNVRIGGTAPKKVEKDLALRLAAELEAAYEPRFGGFGTAPKFPQPSVLRFLLRHHARTGSETALTMARNTLDGMKNGGMYDQLGGGFARYSTDERWHVPHFEKMLYDNGQLARVYLEAFQVTHDPEYARIARETLDYALREMQSPEGGFYSATDADSEGVEGKFFCFSKAEIIAALPTDIARAALVYFDIHDEGNWEGSNVLWTPRNMAEVAGELEQSETELAEAIILAKQALYAVRKTRVPPLLDDKILVSWNALLISALAEGARVLGELRYRQAAERAADDLLHRLRRPDGGLFRTARGPKAQLAAYLEDYAFLGDALVDLYEAGSDVSYLRAAEGLLSRMLKDFRAEAGGPFFQTAHDHEPLIARAQDAQDSALPSGNAVAGQLCSRLSHHLGRDDLRLVAEEVLESFGAWIERAPRAFVSLALLADMLDHAPVEVAIVGPQESPKTTALVAAVARCFVPQRVLSHSNGLKTDASDASALPLLEGKTCVRGAPTAYVCHNFTCSPPLTDPEALTITLLSAIDSRSEALSPKSP